MSAMNLGDKQLAKELTADDLKEIVRSAVREVLREEITSVRLDSRGYLIFPNEAEYAAYLETQKDKLPSEVKALFIDEQGFRVRYSDYEPTPKKARELDAARGEQTVPDTVVRDDLQKFGLKV